MEGEEEAAAASRKSTERKHSLKPHPIFNNYNSWKHKLRENCYKRVREDRRRLLWKMRMVPTPQFLSHIPNDLIKSAFQDIVSAELGKIKDSSLDDNTRISKSVPEGNDVLWEYEGLTDAYQGDCEEMLLEMQRIFYQDLRTEPTTKETEIRVETWEDEEDEYLAQAVFEHMQLNDKQLRKEEVWCPICKHGVLQENYHLIYCSLCEIQLNKGDERKDYEVLHSTSKQVPWYLDDGTFRVNVVGARSAKGFYCTHRYAVFEPSKSWHGVETLDDLENLPYITKGKEDRQVLGVKRIERVLPIGTSLSVIGEAVKDGNGTIRIQRPDGGGPFYVSPRTIDQLTEVQRGDARFFYGGSVVLTLLGVADIGLHFL